MATSSILISMSAETVEALKSGGYVLYGLKAVQTSAQGAPLVWLGVDNFLENTSVAWQDQYQAYVSTDQIVPGGVITDSEACDLDLGQTANVDANGVMTEADGGTDGAITIVNQGTSQWTTGISQLTGGDTTPVFATPLYGSFTDVVAPVEQVLLMFATGEISVGTVLTTCVSPSCLVDMSDSQQAQVSFDIDNGWAWDPGVSASTIQAGADLAPVLVLPM